MAVSQIEEKILGRLARQTAPRNALLSASLFQVLGLSIMLSRKLYRARRLRKLDTTRDTKSLQLYHHIIWLAREGLSTTEVSILPYCQNGQQGPECRVMAAKLRASFYHVFCLYHNHPPISAVSPGASGITASPASSRTTRAEEVYTTRSPGRSRTSNNGNGNGNGKRRRKSNNNLRDAIPSTASDASYVTNIWAGPARTPPPAGPPPPTPIDTRRTPPRPPGLDPINVSASQAAASFILPPLNFVPLAREHFDAAQHLANSLLSPTHALRLTVALEHCAFLWDCAKEYDRSVRLAKRTIRQVYASTEGLDDEEFADASALVQALGGIVRRATTSTSTMRRTSREALATAGSGNMRRSSREFLATTGASTMRRSSRETLSSPRQQQQPQQQQLYSVPPVPIPAQPPASRPPPIDRTIAVSPPTRGVRTPTRTPPTQSPTHSSLQRRGSITRTPERLSTVPELVESGTGSNSESQSQTLTAVSPPISRLSNRSPGARSSNKSRNGGGGNGGGGQTRTTTASSPPSTSGKTSRRRPSASSREREEAEEEERRARKKQEQRELRTRNSAASRNGFAHASGSGSASAGSTSRQATPSSAQQRPQPQRKATPPSSTEQQRQQQRQSQPQQQIPRWQTPPSSSHQQQQGRRDKDLPPSQRSDRRRREQEEAAEEEAARRRRREDLRREQEAGVQRDSLLQGPSTSSPPRGRGRRGLFNLPVRVSSTRAQAQERREAVLRTLEILTSVSRGLYVPPSPTSAGEIGLRQGLRLRIV